MTTDNGLKDLQRSDTKYWGKGRQCGTASKNRDDEEPVCANKQDKHTQRERERERDRHKEMLYFNSNSYK
mgnify:CR=1 FL=1